MKKLALLLLMLPLAACETSPQPHHPFISHWDVSSGRGPAIAAGGKGVRDDSSTKPGLPNYPVYSPAGWGSGIYNR